MIIPVSALIFRGQGLQVATIGKGSNGDVAHLVQVTLGQDDGSTVQVIHGLTADAHVLSGSTGFADRGGTGPCSAASETTGERGPAGMRLRLSPGLVFPGLALLLSGCTVGPNYHRPSAPSAPAFKESSIPPPNPAGGGWKQAAPNDSALRANWWEIYQDPQLDTLEQQISVSKQTLKASYEQYMQAREAVQVYRSQYFPTVNVAPTGSRDRQSQNRPLYVPGSKSTYSDFILQGQVSWEPDLWGSIRRQVELQRATAQATAADLANVGLSLRSELATDYFELRGLDTQQRLLDNTVRQFEGLFVADEDTIYWRRLDRVRCSPGANPVGSNARSGNRCWCCTSSVRACYRHPDRCSPLRVLLWGRRH